MESSNYFDAGGVTEYTHVLSSVRHGTQQISSLDFVYFHKDDSSHFLAVYKFEGIWVSFIPYRDKYMVHLHLLLFTGNDELVYAKILASSEPTR